MATEVIILYKGNAEVKSRLKDILTVEERILLNKRILDKTVKILKEIKEIDLITVLSKSCFSYDGVNVVNDKFEQLNKSIDFLVKNSDSEFFLIIPSDLAYISYEDLLYLISLRHSNDIILVCAKDNGTNGILYHKNNFIGHHFGEDSCRIFFNEAKLKGRNVKRIKLNSLLYDLDSVADYYNYLKIEKGYE